MLLCFAPTLYEFRKSEVEPMKILWLNSGFLHPTTRGGQIRTLQMLRRLRTRHEIHYLALHDGQPEALEHSSEYCSKAWPVPFVLSSRESAILA